MTVKVLEALAEALAPELARHNARKYGIGQKHDLSSIGLRTEYSHGPGGQLTWPGVDPIMFNAALGPESLLSQLPTSGSVYTDPTFAILTGVRAGSGSEKEDPCDDAPVAGLMKSCILHSVFGRYERATDQIEINRLGQRVDRADPMDLTLVGSAIGDSGIFGNANPKTPADLLENEIARLFWERNVAFFQLLVPQVWTGTPLNNSAGGGYKELTGLETLVNTGMVDALTGVACPAADALMRDFGSQRIDESPGLENIVSVLTEIMFQLRYRARRMQLLPVRWVLVMREQLFHLVTAAWSCTYLTTGCKTADGGTSVVNSDVAIQMRDAMRAGRYLMMDGQRYDVVFDDGIPETEGPAGCFATDIYVLPMSVVGGRSVLYLEYFEYSNPAIRDALGKMVLGEIEGAFITWPRQTNLCVQWQSKIEPRLILRTPYLASRLQNVLYCPVEHVRDAFPDGAYFVDGGQVERPGPSYYDPWQQR